MEKKILIILTAILIVLIAVVLFVPAPDKDGNNHNQIETNSQKIRLYNLQTNQTVKSPLIVLGEAAGWYFEASFPARIEDADGNIIAQAPAQAKSDWMTTDFVPFEAKLEFNPPATQTGFVVLMADDPSGMNQNVEYIKIPVIFNDYLKETSEVKVFFSNDKLDPEITCVKVFPVARKVAKTEGIGRAALEALLAGPNPTEAQTGYRTNLNFGVKINSLKIENDLAMADFSPELEVGGGSCLVSAVRAQIIETLKQFPTVNEVKISINGQSEEILQP